MFEQAWAAHSYKSIQRLDLSHNRLTSLQDQGLQFLPLLAHLDLRSNELTSLEESIVALEKCPRLSELYLQVSDCDL